MNRINFAGSPCGKLVSQSAKGLITDEELNAIYAKVNRYKQKGLLEDLTQFEKETFLNEEKNAAAIALYEKKSRSLLDSETETKNWDIVKNYASSGFKYAAESVTKLLTDSMTEVKAAAYNDLGSFFAFIHVNELSKYALDKSNHLDIRRAMEMEEAFKLNDTERFDRLSKMDIPKEAIIIGKRAVELNLEQVNRANDYSSFITNLKGRIHGVHHNTFKMIHPDGGIGLWDRLFLDRAAIDIKEKSSQKSWKDFVRPLLDWDAILDRQNTLDKKTFNKESFLDACWESIVQNGRSGSEITGAIPETQGFTITKNKEGSKQLLWKDAESINAYDNKYGTGDLMATIQKDIVGGSRLPILAKNFGSNPINAVARLVDKAKKIETTEGIRKLGANAFGIDVISAYTNHLVGAIEVADLTYAAAGTAMRNLNVATLLWHSGITSLIMDSAGMASDLRFKNKNMLESYMAPFEALTKSSDEIKKLQVGGINFGVEVMLGKIHEDISSGGLANKLHHGAKYTMDLNQQNWVTDKLKNGSQAVYAHMLGMEAHKSFESLHPADRALIEKYNMGKLEWDIWREHQSEINGRKVLLPGSIRKLDTAYYEAKGFSKREAKLFQNELESKINSLFLDQSEYAVVTPDDRINAVMDMYLPRGSAIGEAARATMQLKSFTLAYVMRPLTRSIENFKENPKAFFEMMGALTAAGTGLYMLKQIEKFKVVDLEKMDKEKFSKYIAAGFFTGGGMGPLGDYINGAINNPNFKATDIAIGPSLSKINQGAQLGVEVLKDLWQGKNEDYAKDTFKSLKYIKDLTPAASIPFANELTNKGLTLMLYKMSHEHGVKEYKRLKQKAEEGGNRIIDLQ